MPSSRPPRLAPIDAGPSLGSRIVAVVVGTTALAACSGLLGLDEFTEAGSGGASSSASSSTDATATTTASTGDTTATTTTSATTTATTGGEGGGAGGSGEGGSGGDASAGGGGATTQCDDPDDCDEPETCTVAICVGNRCGTVNAQEGDSCVEGFCDADGDCVECLSPAQCNDPDSPCREAICDGVCGETDVDDDTPCEGGTCQNGVCDLIAQCQNDQLDIGETDVDCGGVCPRCPNDDSCVTGDDCISGFCGNGFCDNCNGDAQCGGGFYCEDATGQCRQKLNNGATCNDGAECASGNCPGDDGVCCDKPCNADCQSCGSGTCNDANQGTDPGGDCQPGACRSGNCGFGGRCDTTPPGTPCGPGTCNGSEHIPDDLCDVAGNCVDGGIDECAPYNCISGVNGCFDQCQSNQDCATGFTCGGGSCNGLVCAAPPCVLSLRGYGDAGDTVPTGIVVDPQFTGSMFVVGTFSGLLYNGGPGAEGLHDAFLVRLHPTTGSAIWTHTFGAPGEDVGYDVALSGDFTRVFASGVMSEPLDFSGDGTPDVVIDGPADVAGWTSAFTLDGFHEGAIGIGDFGGVYSPAPALAFDGGPTAIVGGVNAGPLNVCEIQGSLSALQGYIGQLTPNGCSSGTPVREDDGNREGVFDIARASSFVYASVVNFDGTIQVNADTVVGSSLVARTDAAGWARAITLEAPRVDATLIDDDLAVVGWMNGTWLFADGGGQTISDSTVGEDALFARYSSTGQLLQLHEMSGSGNQRALAVRFDESTGLVMIGGFFENTISFGFDAGGTQIQLSTNTGRDGFIVAYDDANPVWAVRVGGPGDQVVRGIDIRTTDNKLFAVGSYVNSANAGSKSVSSAGGEDAFIVEIATTVQ